MERPKAASVLALAAALLAVARTGFAAEIVATPEDVAAIRALTGPFGEGHAYALLVTGGVGGWHEPCGCARSPTGGMARRFSLDGLLAEGTPGLPRLWADAGRFAGDPTPAGWVRTEAVVAGMARLGVVAANVGEEEVRAGLDRIAAVAAAQSVPLVSASLVAADGGPPPFAAHRIVEVAGGAGEGRTATRRRVAFIGLLRDVADLDATFAGRRVATRPPTEALRDALAAARAAGADDVVVLAAMSIEEARAVLEAARGVDVLAVASAGAVSSARHGRALVVEAGARGQAVAELRVAARVGDALTVNERFHALDGRVPSDEAGLALEADARRRTNELNRAEAERLVAEAAARRARGEEAGALSPFAAGAACRGCHAAEHLAWERTAHARALATLAAANADFEPACVGCHVTGAGAPGGFRSALQTPELASVQCEACHGPARAHAAGGGTPRTATAGLEACASCHDAANSPGFDAAAAWVRIAHGRTAAVLDVGGRRP